MIYQRPVCATLIACLLAGAAFAQDPAPPADLNNLDAIVGWARQAKVTDDTTNPAVRWSMFAALNDGVMMTGVQSPADAAGVATVGVRLERFQPVGATRSEVILYDLDCNKQTLKVAYSAAYPQHNFMGAKQERAVTGEAVPAAGNPLIASIKDQACAKGSGVPAVNITDERAVRAWITANNILTRVPTTEDLTRVPTTEELAWTFLRGTTEGVLFTAVGRINKPQRTLEISLRREFWQPVADTGMLSELTEYEVNCTTRRMRQLSFSQHSERNLEGKVHGVRKTEGWKPIAENKVIGPATDSMCREFAFQREFVSPLDEETDF